MAAEKIIEKNKDVPKGFGMLKNPRGNTWKCTVYKDGKQITVGLGGCSNTPKEKAISLSIQVSKMINADAPIEEVRDYAKRKLVLYQPGNGLIQTPTGLWFWRRSVNKTVFQGSLGKGKKSAEIKAKELDELIAEGSSVTDIQNNIKEFRLWQKSLKKKNPLAGLNYSKKDRQYLWRRRINGKDYRCYLGTDPEIAERIVPELNRMLEEDGATIEQLRQYVAEQLAVEQMPDLSHLKPPKPKKGVKPAFDWLP